MEDSETPDGKMRRYWVYGLILDSELPFPELVEIPREETAAEVTLRFDQLESVVLDWQSLGPHFRYADNAFLTVICPECRFVCQNGNEIIIEMKAGFSLMEIRTHILGGGLAVILQQRGSFAFHVSAVDTPNGAWAFTGPSGAGKSTSAALIAKRTGWPLITDDVALIQMVDSTPMISGGVVKLKLWKDSMDLVGVDMNTGQQDMWRPEKYHFIQKGAHQLKPVPLARLYVLRPDHKNGRRVVKGFGKVDELAEAIFRNYTVNLFAATAQAQVELIKIANAIEITVIPKINDERLDFSCAL